jgi:hypothetical protein
MVCRQLLGQQQVQARLPAAAPSDLVGTTVGVFDRKGSVVRSGRCPVVAKAASTPRCHLDSQLGNEFRAVRSTTLE